MNITRWGQGLNFENKFRKGIQDLPDSLKSMVIDQMEKVEGKHRSLDGKSRSIGAKIKFIFEFPLRDFLLYLASTWKWFFVHFMILERLKTELGQNVLVQA